MNPISLYIHIPWCIRKCPYCDFNSHQKSEEWPEQRYIKRLIDEAKGQAERIGNRPIATVFIGGGTPSLFEAESYGMLLEALKTCFRFDPQVEITLEANPGTVEQRRFEGYKQVGINRLSLGIQSFSDEKLKALGRIHSSQTAIQAIETMYRTGFEHFNIDLMHGLPQQSVEEAVADLQKALSFKPPHLSWYQLTLEPNTVFYKFPPPIPSDDTVAEMEEIGFSLLKEAGLEQYEVSAFAKPGFECRHNLNYWEFGDYLGLGAGAHSKITDHEGTLYRHANIKRPQSYMENKNVVVDEKIVKNSEKLFEFFLNRWRLNKPIPEKECYETIKVGIKELMPYLQCSIDKGLLIIENDCLLLTERGKLFRNTLLEAWLP
ncbi:MAG TPA: radical SAM family heme chaperone HemW [Coxiellaceae bacterium]|nr:radical SAM family heme chaperone HemW [Coxiellaceae bacterium]